MNTNVIKQEIENWLTTARYPIDAKEALQNVLSFIDSMQEKFEPKYKVGQTIKFIGQYPVYPKIFTISEICNNQYWDKDGCIVPIRYQDDWKLVKEPVIQNVITEPVGVPTGAVELANIPDKKSPTNEKIGDYDHKAVM